MHWSKRSMRVSRLFLLGLSVLAVVAAPSGGAQAQRGGGGEPAPLPREFFEDRLDREGDTIVFCVNEDAMMADFERDLAEEIGNALLLNVEIYNVDPPRPTIPLDYRLPLIPEQLFLVLVDYCNAMFGFTLSQGYQDYLSITRPYMDTDYALVFRSDQYQRLTDVPLDERIGTRSMNNGDIALTSYLRTLPENQRWRRSVYFDNEILIERLLDGTIGAAVIWKPAVYFATEGDPESAGLRLLPVPFAVAPTQIGLGMLAGDDFVRTSLDEAIAVLVEEGVVAELLARHHLVPNETRP